MAYAQPRSIALVKYAVPTHLRTSLQRALPRASWRALAVVDAMLLTEGAIGCAGRVARRLGFRSRFDFAHWLARQGLPPLHELAGWVSVLLWVELCARTGMSLCAFALHRGRDPAACYRLVQRVTGRSWSQVRAFGFRWVLNRFVARCREGAVEASELALGGGHVCESPLAEIPAQFVIARPSAGS